MEVRLSSRYITMINPSGSSLMVSSMIGKDSLRDSLLNLSLVAGKHTLRTVMLKSCLISSSSGNN